MTFSVSSTAGKRWPVKGKRLVHEFPYIEAEVRYAIKEYALTAVDVLARRTSLAFLNVEAAEDALPRVVEIMAEELQWNKQQKKVRASVPKLLLYLLLSVLRICFTRDYLLMAYLLGAGFLCSLT